MAIVPEKLANVKIKLMGLKSIDTPLTVTWWVFKVDEKDNFEVPLDGIVAALSNAKIQQSDNRLKYIFSKSNDFTTYTSVT